MRVAKRPGLQAIRAHGAVNREERIMPLAGAGDKYVCSHCQHDTFHVYTMPGTPSQVTVLECADCGQYHQLPQKDTD